MQLSNKTIGIILFLIGIDGLLAVFVGFHLLPYILATIILIMIGAYLAFKKDAEK